MSYIDNLGSDRLLTVAADLRKRYNDARKEFYDASRHYFNQSIASNYYTEAALSEKLEKCRKLKEQYSEIKAILHSRNVHTDVGAWQRSNDDVFIKA